MRGCRLHPGLTVARAIVAGLLFLTAACSAAQETVLHSFHPSASRRRVQASADGFAPFYGNLTIDAAGNLYGITSGGGSFNYGTVFEYTPTDHGWVRTMQYSFSSEGGSDPYGGLVLDASGNLYGTTFYGGDNGAGVVFELVHEPDGGWTKKVLHNFNTTDGYGPYASMVFDDAGNLYGTTTGGGDYNEGTVFELTPNADGSWTEQVLHSFGNGIDGWGLYGPVVLDAVGNIYGMTSYGGATQSCADEPGCGTVFKLSPRTGGGWTEQVLHSFLHDGIDGRNPFANGLIFDAQGNLYGMTSVGGVHPCEGVGGEGCGTVFGLTPAGGGTWTEQILFNFNNDGGAFDPTSSLLFDAAGNLYGTSYSGGATLAGTVFKLTYGSGGWTEQVLHSFGGSGDGVTPGAGLVRDAAGNLYGTTMQGGAYSGGTVYEFTP